MKSTFLKPVISEKTMALTEANNTYAFVVSAQLSKPVIARSISQQFDVEVESIRVTNLKGKPKNALVQKGRRRLEGSRPDQKKAYVKLAKGQSIKLFDEPKAKPQKGKGNG